MGGKDQEGPPMGNHDKEIMFIFYYKYCRKYSIHVKKFAFCGELKIFGTHSFLNSVRKF